ncbi:MAG TPA: cyclic nucleotide-binding domain-containing protein [Acidobacteriota bacterium]|nr:cyclic nucleotide-binding domain-containing protein [Acidobacteriota bacterium]
MLTTIERVLMLQELDLFRFATTEHVAQFASIANERYLEPRENLFRPGDSSDHLLLVVRGRVQLFTARGDELRVVEQAPLNLWEFFAQARLDYEARAIDHCLVLYASTENVEELLTGEPEFCYAVLRHLARLGFRQGKAQSILNPKPISDVS